MYAAYGTVMLCYVMIGSTALSMGAMVNVVQYNVDVYDCGL